MGNRGYIAKGNQPCLTLAASNGSYAEGNLLDLESRFANELCRTTGCQKAYVLLNQTLGEVEQSSLVVNRKYSCISH